MYNIYNFFFINKTTLILGGIFLATILCIPIKKLSREWHRNSNSYIVADMLLLASVFVIILIHINHIPYLFSGTSEPCKVLDKRIVSGRIRWTTKYRCVVSLKTGSEIEIPVDRYTYDSLQLDDGTTYTLDIYNDIGLLGVEYVYLP